MRHTTNFFKSQKLSNRHHGMESRQAILPDALRVNANLFQTDLCRDPEHRDVLIQTTVYPIKSEHHFDRLRILQAPKNTQTVIPAWNHVRLSCLTPFG
jgi:hypothetical protein